MCLYQRIPYVISIIICFFGYFFSKNKIWLFTNYNFFISCNYFRISFGIENNIFNEFSGCTNENIDTINKKELLQSLNNVLPNCKDVNFRIFGLSLATINFILSIALAFYY